MTELTGSFVGHEPRLSKGDFTIADFGVTEGESNSPVVTVVGAYDFGIVSGRPLKISGEWKAYQGRPQFRMEYFRPVESLPTSPEGIMRFLQSLSIPGVGAVTLRRIVERYGAEIYAALDAGPERLIADGLEAKKAKSMHEVWSSREDRTRDDDEAFLRGLALSARQAKNIFEKYGQSARQTVQANPYKLSEEISGVGFITADKIGQQLGVPFDSDFRIAAGILEALRLRVKAGDCYIERQDLCEKTEDLLTTDDGVIPIKRIDPLIDQLAERGAVVIDGEAHKAGDIVYTPEIFEAENYVAQEIAARASAPVVLNDRTIHGLISRSEADYSITFTDEQRRAVFDAVTSRVSVLTGGPGTGKTSITRAICDVFESFDKRIALASFTAKAALRLQEVVAREGRERDAKTIHSLLVWNAKTNTFYHDEEKPLPHDVVIVDEASMLSLSLARDLMAAIPRGAQIVFVGDDAQLPSIGAGAVLRDLIEAEVIPVSRLSKVFRQGEGLILDNADLIRRGRMPMLREGDDFRFIEEADQARASDHVMRLVLRDLPARGFKPSDIQVLAPQKRGDAGIKALNRKLQAGLNPPRADKAELPAQIEGERVILREGDKVMQRVNDYKNDVINGQAGVIVSVDPKAEAIDVVFTRADGGKHRLTYERDDFQKKLMHGFCQSVHKSQGSEYPAVVLAFFGFYELLNRNLLYTALTRAKRMAVIVGTQKNIEGALRRMENRRTTLRMRLKGKAQGATA